jgi:phosphoribosylcarboxyaminoimidazole (NCAIR) mutase
MPGGVAPAVVLDPAGAAFLAAKILGLGDPAIQERVVSLQQKNLDRIVTDDQTLGA